jgi:hypothetical protein
MVECIFTIDYEIYGNGEGSLNELVLEPAKQLKTIFDRAGAKFVVFVEAAELEKMDRLRTDPAIDDVKSQVQEFYEEGFEIGLHLHPQWCNARYSDGKWELDYTEYNLCTLPESRIGEIVGRSIRYLRDMLDAPDFTPLSFRAGSWLFQPTYKVAPILAEHGIKIDSSVFKGGRQHKYNLDYRKAKKNGYYWNFDDDVAVPSASGVMLELPIYTKMVPFWQLATSKRLGLQNKAASQPRTASGQLDRFRDLLRLRQPLKFDFCRMTIDELTATTEEAIQEDRCSPAVFKPMVLIGHTKDLIDLGTVEHFLAFLRKKNIAISTFEGVYRKCQPSTLSDPNGTRNRSETIDRQHSDNEDSR